MGSAAAFAQHLLLLKGLGFLGESCYLGKGVLSGEKLFYLGKAVLPGESCYLGACTSLLCSRKGSRSMGSCEPQIRLGDYFLLLLSLSGLCRAP